MLSSPILTRDEVADGKTFILKLWDVVGEPTLWLETLRGEAARRWYDIYLRCDWEALRAEAAGVFRHRVSRSVAATALTSGRCVYIHTLMVETGELRPAGFASAEVSAAGAREECPQ